MEHGAQCEMMVVPVAPHSGEGSGSPSPALESKVLRRVGFEVPKDPSRETARPVMDTENQAQRRDLEPSLGGAECPIPRNSAV